MSSPHRASDSGIPSGGRETAALTLTKEDECCNLSCLLPCTDAPLYLLQSESSHLLPDVCSERGSGQYTLCNLSQKGRDPIG